MCTLSPFLGPRGCAPAAPTNLAGRPVLHGQDIHGDLFFRDVDQVVGARLPGVLYERLVLARFHHCDGKCASS